MKRVIVYPLAGTIAGAVAGLLLTMSWCKTMFITDALVKSPNASTMCPAMFGMLIPAQHIMILLTLAGLALGIFVWWSTRGINW